MAESDNHAAFAFGDSSWPGLAKLNEECGEVLQIIGKIMMIHGGINHWSGNLRTMLRDEIGDLSAAILFLRIHVFTDAENAQIRARIDEKSRKFETWHAHPEDDVPPMPEGADR